MPKITRRSFLELMGATALFGLTACEEKFRKLESNEILEHSLEVEAREIGEWKPVTCWDNCGGRCILNAHVVDGKVTKLRTDTSEEDSFDNPQRRACARGRSQRQRVLGVERLKYPMKRISWSPEKPNGHLRGKDSWERISWDEALTYIANEAKRIKKDYGNESIYVLNGGETARTFSLFGGFTSKFGSRSRGAWKGSMEPITGVDQKRHLMNDRLDLLKSKLIVLWGNNPAYSSMGGAVLHLLRAKEKGIKFIVIDPLYSQTAEVFADEFYPVRPATDTPLMLSIMYVLLEEDTKENGYIDWEFLNKCTVGFDKEHMPEGADPNENLKDYILGTYDGIPKDPEWASKICGTSVDDIYKIARTLGSTKPATIYFSWNSARVEKGTHVPLAQISLGAMLGNMGIEGGCTSVSCQETSANGGTSLIKAGESGIEDLENPISTKLCTNEHWQAILDKEYTAGKVGKKPIDIRMIYHSHAACLSQTNNINKGIEAHRSVDIVVTHQHFLDTNAMFSDIVLPVTTPWEKDGYVLNKERELLTYTSKVIEPFYECKDDMWIAKELAKKLDINPLKVEPISYQQQIYNQIAGAKVMMENGKDYETLVTITQADIDAWGVEGIPQKGRITLKDIKEKGFYKVKRSQKDNHSYIHNKKFREDPDNNPLETQSGKLEIHCQALADKVTDAGWNKGNPIAIYEPPTEGYEATFSDFEKGIKGKYPLQVCCIHGQRHTHSLNGHTKWLRRVFPYNIMVNPTDAKERGIMDGETVRLFNDNGSIVRKVELTEKVMPGVVYIYEGPAVELDENGNCLAGSPNILTGDYPSGPDIESFTPCIAQMKKHDVEASEDWEKALREVEL